MVRKSVYLSIIRLTQVQCPDDKHVLLQLCRVFRTSLAGDGISVSSTLVCNEMYM